MKPHASEPQKKWLAILILIGLILASILVIRLIGIPMLKLASEPETFRQWLKERKLGGQLIYMGMVLIQTIVAVIPGEPLEIAGGYAFGAIEGSILCLVSETLGGIIIFFLVRRFGTKLVQFFFSPEKLHTVRFLKHSPQRTILFLLVFMIPGTPKDLLCFFAGLTELNVLVFLLITSLGRIPSIITSTLGGNALGTKRYVFAGLVFVITLLISFAGLMIYRTICTRHNQKTEPSDRKKK